MPDWLSRETAIDVSINGAPLFILVYSVGLFLVSSPWGDDPLSIVLMLSLLAIPATLLPIATYYAARAIERDAIRSAEGDPEAPEEVTARLPSIYTPEGTLVYVIVGLGAILLLAVAYLLVFTDAAIPF